MLIDSKGKLFGKISVVDIIIVVIVIGALAGIAYKLNKSNVVSPLAKSYTIQTVLYTDATTESSAQAIKEGDTVKDKVTGAELGKVVKIETGPSIIYGINADGKVVASEKPGYVSLKITVQGKGNYDSMGATFGSSNYYINKAMQYVYGSYFGNARF